ncbi:hypothetical protein MKX03_034822 [Papaver bracteatum]|nr:hypothetical protein MKX03_034822 [Papaver bracteatum]
MNFRKCKKHLHAKYVVHLDASNTLFFQWLPSTCTQREFSRILFISRLYLYVFFCLLRTVSPPDSRGDPLVPCFVDFINHVQAATALGSLQGEHKKLALLLSSLYVKLIFPFPLLITILIF